MMVDKFRKLPVEVEALQWTGSNDEEMEAFIGGPIVTLYTESGRGIVQIKTVDGNTCDVYPRTYVIKGVQGELYPCKEEIFLATYEPIVPDPEDNDE